MIRKTLLGLVATAAIAAPLMMAGSASAITPTGNSNSEFALVAWQLPDGSWPQDHGQDIYPQTLAAEQFLTYDEVIPNVMGSVDSLDATLNALPGCHTYQVDLYFNNGDNAGLVKQVLSDGVLNAFEDTSLNLVVHNANKMFTVSNCTPPVQTCVAHDAVPETFTTVHHAAIPGSWSNFEPNKSQKTFAGPPTWPTDARGTWSAPKTNGGPQQDAVGVYQNGNGNGSWFHRTAATAAYDEKVSNHDGKPAVTCDPTCATFTAWEPAHEANQWAWNWRHDFTVKVQSNGDFAGVGVQNGQASHGYGDGYDLTFHDTPVALTGHVTPSGDVSYTETRTDHPRTWTLTSAPTVVGLSEPLNTGVTTNSTSGDPVPWRISRPVTVPCAA